MSLSTAIFVDRSLREGINQAEMVGLATVFWMRIVALASLAVWVGLTLPPERSSLYIAALLVFALIGAPPYLLARAGLRANAVTAFFFFVDAAFLTVIFIIPSPVLVDGWTPQLNLRLPSFLFLGLYLSVMAVSYSPVLVLWAGVALTSAWTTGYLFVAGLPGSLPTTAQEALDGSLAPAEAIARYLDPRTVSLTSLVNQVVFLALMTAILMFAVWWSRRLVYRQVAADRQRSSLSRYFSPNLVNALAEQGDALPPPALQPAAVLFADMVGFTGLSERLPPAALISLLGDFHERLARVAFAHGGTVDKYIGDAIMVHFGTPHTRADDPVRALRAAAQMIAEIEKWNIERSTRNEEKLAIGIGVHFGEVLCGNIGVSDRLEYTVLGDTVNVAAHLERLTREIHVPLVVSDALVRSVRHAGVDPAEIAELTPLGSRPVRGRCEPVEVWFMPLVASGDRWGPA